MGDKFSEAHDAFPEAEGDGVFEQQEHCIEDVQIRVVLRALFDELFDILQDGVDVELLLFFLFALEGTLGLVYVFLADDPLLLSLVAVPATDGFDGFDGSELAVGYVDVVGDANERLVHVCYRVNHLPCSLVCLLYQLVQVLYLGVIQDYSHYLESDQGRNVLNGVAVLVHADVRQQVYEL